MTHGLRLGSTHSRVRRGRCIIGKPQAPDPWETSAAQGQWNAFTAQQQQMMNMTGQQTPWGSLEYSQSGTQTIVGPDGRPVEVPMWTATTTLSPEQQAIFNQSQQAQGSLAGLAADQAEKMRAYLSDPFSYSVGEHEEWAGGLYDSLNQGNAQRDREALHGQLINQGLQPGSRAYNDAMQNMLSGQQTSRDRFMLDSYNTGLGSALQFRNQPINELSALLSGTQVGMPNFVGTPQTGVAGVDHTGNVNNAYNQQMQQWGAGMGGLFGLGGALLGSPLMSDRRAKTDIKRVGQTDGGVPIYTFRYKDDESRTVHMGVMAQDVPHARVMGPDGFYRVHYSEVS